MSSDVSYAEEILSVLRDVLDKGPRDLAGSWKACAEAGLLGLAAPASYDGEDLGLPAVDVLVREVASRARDLPLADTLAGLLVLGAHDDPQLVPRIVAGDLVVATGEGGSLEDGVLRGYAAGVPVTDLPTVLLVATGDVAVVVDPDAPGVSRSTTPTSSDLVEATYRFDGVTPLAVLPAGSAASLREHVTALRLAEGAGLLAGARDLTATYVGQREQFGRRLAEFQGVAMQVADVYVASRLVSLAADEVVRRVSAGEPSADDAAVAAYWFGTHGLAALQTCHHLHGGMGVDQEYALHRYFARAKDVARQLGGSETALAAVPLAGGDGLELTEEQRAFRQRVREYFATLVGDEDRREMMTDRHGPAYHRIIRKMGDDGWMGVGWPQEYGGHGLGGVEQQVFANEAARADVHLPAVTLQTVGPTLQAFGTPHQKDLFLKRILAGDVHFAIGYSEPDAGTDLAALRTTARREGDHYVVNGQKLWTTGGHAADYLWLAVRTDPDAPKHQGISVLIVDTRAEGYSWTPIITSDGSHHVNATYFNDVRVPVDMLVGEENQGWRLITTQLNHERVMLGPAGRIEGLRDLVVDWASTRTTPDGTPVLDVPWVRSVVARATAAFRVNELLNWSVASGAASGKAAVADASASKVFASEAVQSLGLELESVVATYGDPTEPETAWLRHYLDATSKRNLVLTFGGGVNEVQRELVAMFGLGLPKVPR